MQDVRLMGTGSKDGAGIYHVMDGVYKAYLNTTLDCMTRNGQASIKRVRKGGYLSIDKHTSCKGAGFGFGEEFYEVEYKKLVDLPAIHPSRIREKTRQGMLAFKPPIGYGSDQIQKEIQDDISRAKEDLDNVMNMNKEIGNISSGGSIMALVALILALMVTTALVSMLIKIRWNRRQAKGSGRADSGKIYCLFACDKI